MKGLLLGCALAGIATIAVSSTVDVTRPQARPDRVMTPVSDAPPPVEPRPAMPDGRSDQPPLATAAPLTVYTVSPPARPANLPRTRFQHKQNHALWTRVALSALKTHGKPLVEMVPADIDDWCPAYATAPDRQRRAFWVGFLSALSKHESTYKAQAVGGGGQWYGLLQILPATARNYNCNVGTGEALKSGGANLSCAVRIMAKTVPRDGVIYGPGGRGVAADWGPLRSGPKRADMANWLKRQAYCKPLDATRPKPRP